jgi:hypothetical protein
LAADNKIKFNEGKSKVMLMSRRKREERNEIAIYLNKKPIPQVQRLKYLGIIFDRKLTFKEHINSKTKLGLKSQSPEDNLPRRNITPTPLRHSSVV